MSEQSAGGVEQGYPGSRLGLPAEGRGSVATWWARIGALIVDWAASMVIAVGLGGVAVLHGDGWRQFLIMITFFLESTVLSAFAGGSFGQLLCRITVARVDGRPLGILRAALRQLMVCLVLPAVVADRDRRGLHDLAVNTVVLTRR